MPKPTIFRNGASITVVDTAPVVPPPANAVAVNLAQRFQTIEGWTLTAIAWEVSKLTNAYDPTWVANKALACQMLVEQLGITRVQIPVRSGWLNPVDYWSQFVAGTIGRAVLESNWYRPQSGAPIQFSEFDHTVQHMLLPMMAAAQAVGRTIAVELVFTDFTNNAAGRTLDFATSPTQYANFVGAFVDRLTASGISTLAVDVILEPDNRAVDAFGAWRTPSNIGHAIVALRARLPAVEIIAPSCMNHANTVTYCNAIAGVPGALAALGVVAYHLYDDASGGHRPTIKAWAQSRGKRLAMSEFFNGTLETVFDDLALGDVALWQKWSMGGRIGSGSNPQAHGVIYDGTSVTLAPNSAALRMVFPLVRPGAVRVGLTVPATILKAAAFEHPDGRITVAMKATGPTTVTLTGLRPGTYGIRSCSAFDSIPFDRADVTVGANGQLPLSIASRYTTVHAR